MDEASDDITADQRQAWIRHSRRFFPSCMNYENIPCDVDENLWPNPDSELMQISVVYTTENFYSIYSKLFSFSSVTVFFYSI